MDGGALWAAVHGVAKSWARLSDFTFTFHFHSSILAWRIPGTEEPGGLLSMGLHRVGHDWSDLAAATAVWLLFELGPLRLLMENRLGSRMGVGWPALGPCHPAKRLWELSWPGECGRFETMDIKDGAWRRVRLPGWWVTEGSQVTPRFLAYYIFLGLS